jgi:hypothetical protein
VERPIVVCGPARGGTTATRAILNGHPEVSLAGEVPIGRLPSMRALLDEIAAFHGDGWTAERRAEVVCALWYAASRSRVTPGRRWGMKTPWAELRAPFWEEMVDPLYVFSLRRGDRVFQSRLRLKREHTLSGAEMIDRYKRSIRKFEELQARGKAYMVQIDLSEGVEERRRVAEGIFDFIGEDPGERRLAEIAADNERVSNPTSKPGEEPQLPPDLQQMLDEDEEYQELMVKYGYR